MPSLFAVHLSTLPLLQRGRIFPELEPEWGPADGFVYLKEQRELPGDKALPPFLPPLEVVGRWLIGDASRTSMKALVALRFSCRLGLIYHGQNL